jgi:hypothetical protein
MSPHKKVQATRHELQRHHPQPALTGHHADQLLTPVRARAIQDRAAVRQASHHLTRRVAQATSESLNLPGHEDDNTHDLCQTTQFSSRLTPAPSAGT